jgi:flagellar basal body-associated protein FliL
MSVVVIIVIVIVLMMVVAGGSLMMLVVDSDGDSGCHVMIASATETLPQTVQQPVHTHLTTLVATTVGTDGTPEPQTTLYVCCY